MYKQLIIARKDLNMSSGKLAAQVSHASIAFLLEKILWGSKEVVRERDGIMDISLDTDWKKRVLKGLSLVLDLDQWKLRRLIKLGRNINYTIKGYFCPNCGEKMKG